MFVRKRYKKKRNNHIEILTFFPSFPFCAVVRKMSIIFIMSAFLLKIRENLVVQEKKKKDAIKNFLKPSVRTFVKWNEHAKWHLIFFYMCSSSYFFLQFRAITVQIQKFRIFLWMGRQILIILLCYKNNSTLVNGISCSKWHVATCALLSN